MISQLILIWLYSSLQKRAKPESGLTHEAAEYSIESFEFIVSEQVQINPTSNEWVNIFIIEIEYTANKNRQGHSSLPPLVVPLATINGGRREGLWERGWCNGSDVLNLHHDNDVKEVFFNPSPMSRGTNQPIRQEIGFRCMKVE